MRRGVGKLTLGLAQEFEFLDEERELAISVSFFTMSDHFTKWARVLAIEGSLHRDGKRSSLKIAGQHSDPSNRLQECPMQPN
jgi:hypothetical protein